MNLSPIGRSLAPYRAAIRQPVASTVEQSYGSGQPARISTDVASLSLETRLDLSQKAQVLPPPPPPESTRKTPPARRESQVSTTDFTGRSCSGSLHGPLLMEDPMMEVQSLDSRPAAFKSVDFVFENTQDFAPMRSASLALAALEPSILHAPASQVALATVPSSDSSFAYFGVKNGVATIVQQFDNDQPQAFSQDSGQVRLPDGQVAFISRAHGPAGQLSIHLPATSLDPLADWGRSLLAIA
ncbi:hypothetical protein IV102_22805 [bacterium]|nr:hypothetical protein [bacterium]